MRKLFTLIAAAAALGAPLSAHALNFDFSFSNTLGQTPGTVTGELFGLTDNATSAPTDVVITSYPAALTGLPAAPWDLYTIPGFEFGEHGTPLLANHFTVSGGVITNAEFGLFTAAGDGVLDLGYGGVDVLIGPPVVGSGDVGTNASTDIFFQAPGDANGGPNGGVPEPAAWALMIGGLFGVGAMLRRRAGAAALG